MCASQPQGDQNSQVVSLTQDLRQSSEQVSALKSKLAEQGSQDGKAEIDKLKAELQQSAALVASFKKESAEQVATMKKDLAKQGSEDASKGQVDELKVQLRKSVETQYAFKAQVDKLKGELRQSSEQVAALKSLLTDKSQLHSEYSPSASQAREKELKAMLVRAAEKVSAMESELASQDSLQEIKAQVDGLRAELQRSAQEVASLRSELANQVFIYAI